MDVSDDGDGCLDVDDVALAHQELLCLFANLFEERLAEELFPQQDRDGAIEVEHVWLLLSGSVETEDANVSWCS